MITPEIPAVQKPDDGGRSMRLPVDRSNRDLVLPMSGRHSRDVTEPPRCGVLQYPTGTYFDGHDPD